MSNIYESVPSSQPTTLLSLPNELLLEVLRSSPDLDHELIYLGRTCRRLNSLCIPLYLERKGIVFHNLVEDGERANVDQPLSEDAAFPNIRAQVRDNTLEIYFPGSVPRKQSRFDALALNFEEIPCGRSSENLSPLPNLSSEGHCTGIASAGTPTLHRIDFIFHPPSNLQSLLRFFSRIEYFLRRRHIRTNIVTLYNLQPTGSLENGADLNEWLGGLTGLLDAILGSGCRTLEIMSIGDKTTSHYAFCQETPQIWDGNPDKRADETITQTKAALPKLAFRRLFPWRKSRPEPLATTPTTPTTSDPATPQVGDGSRFTPLQSPSGSWSYKPSRSQRDPPILAEMSNFAQQACRLTCLTVSTPTLIVPPASNWLFTLLQLPTCPLTKLGLTHIGLQMEKWEAFFECLEACFLLKEKAVKSANGRIGTPVLKELCISHCHGIPRGAILKLLSSLNGLETVKLEVLRLESLTMDPQKGPDPYRFLKEEILGYPSDPRFTRVSILPSATMEPGVFGPELPHLISLTIPSNWAHDFPFQSSPTHLRTLFIQVQGDISSSQFWLEGGGRKLARLLPLYSTPKSILFGLHIRILDLFASFQPHTMSEAETLRRANVCPFIHCLVLDGQATWKRKPDEVSAGWLSMFPNLTHVKVGTTSSGPRHLGQKRVEIRLKTLFGGCKTLKTVECEGVVYDRETWKEGVELLRVPSPAAALVSSPGSPPLGSLNP
ncbi:hypothetical protein BDN72DRAFT_894909 [Pluteus cervinus]|uniref:Uncharacterized protein n=1 Tax=Pluteus cervinus TaxID=181527 RepID=A0ACD3B3N0_9AGAR|nr:hypothetical protein BDN72DRAFT_894909 [Pluteus cervinus]